MAKAKWAEIEQARRDGMGYALKIAREKGIEGLEEEVKFRNISKVSVAMSDEEYKELVKCDYCRQCRCRSNNRNTDTA